MGLGLWGLELLVRVYGGPWAAKRRQGTGEPFRENPFIPTLGGLGHSPPIIVSTIIRSL